MIARRRLLEGAAALVVAGCAPKAVTLAPPPAGKPSDVLGDLDGLGVAQRIKAGDFTPREAAEAAINRAEALNPKINAIVTAAYEDARRRAAAPITGPFAGAPTLIKDLNPLKGVAFESGTRAYRGRIATTTEPYIEAVIAAGLNPIGKSATPEFGLTATTEPMLSPPTRNPWNLDHSSGGSSGGAAAAVAAGIVPVAHASDGGGSIRIPASCCGLFGLKPSRGRTIGSPGPSPVDLGVEHCVSRSVRDSAAWLAATERGDAQAPYKPLGFIGGLAAGADKKPLRIGIATTTMAGKEPSQEVLDAIEDARALCASLGHTVMPMKPLIGGEALTRHFMLYWAAGAAEEAAAAMKANPGAAPETILEPWTLGLMDLYRAAPADAMPKAIAALKDVGKQYLTLFDGVDVMMTPVLARPPVKLGEIAPTRPFKEVLPVLLDYVAYTPVENIAGAPAMSAPLWWTKDGLPVGVHFAAAPGQEAMLLSLAYQLEAARGWAKRKPATHA